MADNKTVSATEEMKPVPSVRVSPYLNATQPQAQATPELVAPAVVPKKANETAAVPPPVMRTAPTPTEIEDVQTRVAVRSAVASAAPGLKTDQLWENKPDMPGVIQSTQKISLNQGLDVLQTLQTRIGLAMQIGEPADIGAAKRAYASFVNLNPALVNNLRRHADSVAALRETESLALTIRKALPESMEANFQAQGVNSQQYADPRNPAKYIIDDNAHPYIADLQAREARGTALTPDQQNERGLYNAVSAAFVTPGVSKDMKAQQQAEANDTFELVRPHMNDLMGFVQKYSNTPPPAVGSAVNIPEIDPATGMRRPGNVAQISSGMVQVIKAAKEAGKRSDGTVDIAYGIENLQHAETALGTEAFASLKPVQRLRLVTTMGPDLNGARLIFGDAGVDTYIRTAQDELKQNPTAVYSGFADTKRRFLTAADDTKQVSETYMNAMRQNDPQGFSAGKYDKKLASFGLVSLSAQNVPGLRNPDGTPTAVLANAQQDVRELSAIAKASQTMVALRENTGVNQDTFGQYVEAMRTTVRAETGITDESVIDTHVLRRLEAASASRITEGDELARVQFMREAAYKSKDRGVETLSESAKNDYMFIGQAVYGDSFTETTELIPHIENPERGMFRTVSKEWSTRFDKLRGELQTAVKAGTVALGSDRETWTFRDEQVPLVKLKESLYMLERSMPKSLKPTGVRSSQLDNTPELSAAKRMASGVASVNQFARMAVELAPVNQLAKSNMSEGELFDLYIKSNPLTAARHYEITQAARQLPNKAKRPDGDGVVFTPAEQRFFGAILPKSGIGNKLPANQKVKAADLSAVIETLDRRVQGSPFIYFGQEEETETDIAVEGGGASPTPAAGGGQNTPKIGDIIEGYKYIGGDPTAQSSYEPVK